MEILKKYLKVKYCEVNKESILHIENTIIIHLITKERSKYAKLPVTALVTQ
jgi:hypothetical protein